MPRQPLWILQILSVQITLISGLGIPQPAQARPACPGYQAQRTYRERSDHEAPLLPRTSIAAIAIQSPGGCDRSSEERLDQQTRQTPDPAGQFQQSEPTDQAMPAPEQPAKR